MNRKFFFPESEGRLWRWSLFLLALLHLAGCTTPPRQHDLLLAPYGLVEEDENSSWWACRFTIHRPEGQDTDFAVDLLLAHAVIGPTLRTMHEEMGYWRFHRRSADDEAGHRFSFMFYAPARTAAAVYGEVEQNPLLQNCLAGGMVESLDTDDRDVVQQTAIGDTSDQSWSDELKNNWPVYIMGVSALWLGLIDETLPSTVQTEDCRSVLAEYRDAAKAIDDIWRKEGGHALFHHLNAIFGYEPLLMRF